MVVVNAQPNFVYIFKTQQQRSIDLDIVISTIDLCQSIKYKQSAM